MHLLPRDVKFYDQFLSQSRLAVKASSVLRSAVESGGGRVAEAAGELRELERKGDDLEHEVFRRLHKTFITPIDPEDVQAIASALDRVLGGIEALGYRLNAYGFTQIPKRMQDLARVLEECTKALDAIFERLNEHGLEEQDPLTEQCARVNELENQSQTIVREGVTEAFAREKDPIELMKMNAIFEHFEMAGDRCEDVADLISNVLAKKS